MIKFVKNDLIKIVNKNRALVAILKEDGWKEEKPKAEKIKTKKSKEQKPKKVNK